MPRRKRKTINTSESVTDLARKLDAIAARLDTIEAALAAGQHESELISILRNLRFGVSLYSEPLNALRRLYEARRFLEIEAVEKDEISLLIVQALMTAWRSIFVEGGGLIRNHD